MLCVQSFYFGYCFLAVRNVLQYGGVSRSGGGGVGGGAKAGMGGGRGGGGKGDERSSAFPAK